MALGKRVKQRRKELNLEQGDIAGKINMTQSAISILEKRDSKSSRNLSELAKALGVTENWLEKGTQPKIPNKTFNTDPVFSSAWNNLSPKMRENFRKLIIDTAIEGNEKFAAELKELTGIDMHLATVETNDHYK